MNGWKSWPIPEMIGGGDWTVKKSHKGGVNVGKQTMSCPTDSTLGGITVRNHEMCHAAFTPRTGKKPSEYGVSKRALGSAEDYRIGQLGLRKGVKFWEYRKKELEALKAMVTGTPLVTGATVDRQNRRLLAVYAVLSGECFDEFGRKETMRQIPKEMQEEVRKVVAGAKAIFAEDPALTFETGIKVAKFLDDTLGVMKGGVSVEGSDVREGDGIPEPFEGVYQVNDGSRWGEMEIARPRLVRRARILHERKKGAKFRSLEEGVIPARPHRMYVDQRVFHVKTGILGGTMLIDRSGSMAIPPKQVSDLVEARPRVLVADYSGRHEEGTLRILVRNGKTVSIETMQQNPSSGGNIIDGPALRWLVKQPKPHIWISDGQVTGIGDRTSEFLASDAADIMAIGQVMRYESIKHFMDDKDGTQGKNDLKDLYAHAGFAWWLEDEQVKL